MTTKPTELCIGTPEAFNGSFAKAKPWLHSVQFYLEVNKDVYNTDAKKIAFALSYMTKGPAFTWATTFRTKALSTGTITMGSFDDFVKTFDKSFEHHDTVGNAVAWLSTKRMQSKRDGIFKPSLTTYISEFQNNVALSKITDNNVLIGYFSSGIPTPLMQRIYAMETVPDQIDDWYKHAQKFQTQYERAKEVENR